MELHVRKGAVNIIERLYIILVYVKLKYNTWYYYILLYITIFCSIIVLVVYKGRVLVGR
jgi:hypothetical protein